MTATTRKRPSRARTAAAKAPSSSTTESTAPPPPAAEFRPPVSDAARRPGRPSNSDKLAEAMAANYALAALLLAHPAPRVAKALAGSAADCGKAWAQLADQHPAVRRFLEAASTSGGAMALVIAHAPIATAVYVELSERADHRQAVEAAKAATQPAAPIPDEYPRPADVGPLPPDLDPSTLNGESPRPDLSSVLS